MQLPSGAARGAMRVPGLGLRLRLRLRLLLGLRRMPVRVPGRMFRPVLMLVLACTIGACTPAEAPRSAPPARPSQLAAPAPEDAGALMLPDLMELLVDPAAGVLLAAADLEGGDDAEPPAAEAWQAVVDAALQLMRASEMLEQPALSLGRSDWLRFAAALREAAAAGSTAAGRHDAPGLAEAGARVRASCSACHALYARETTEAGLRGLSR